MIQLGIKVGKFGRIAAVKFTQRFGREYLLIGGGVVSWFSESDVEALLSGEAQQ